MNFTFQKGILEEINVNHKENIFKQICSASRYLQCKHLFLYHKYLYDCYKHMVQPIQPNQEHLYYSDNWAFFYDNNQVLDPVKRNEFN